MSNVSSVVIAVVIAVIGSNGIWAFLQFILTRKDKEVDRLTLIEQTIEKISATIAENQAILSRTHILRFSDELQNGVRHSQEYFRQQLDDIDTYDKYCKAHPDFLNSYTISASSHIKTVYDKLLKDGEFKHE